MVMEYDIGTNLKPFECWTKYFYLYVILVKKLELLTIDNITTMRNNNKHYST